MRALGPSYSLIRHRTNKLNGTTVILLLIVRKGIGAGVGNYGRKGQERKDGAVTSDSSTVSSCIREGFFGGWGGGGAGGSHALCGNTVQNTIRLEATLPSVSKLSLFSVFLFVAGRAYTDGRGGGGGTISHDGEKAWSSKHHSILSVSSYGMYRQSSCVAENLRFKHTPKTQYSPPFPVAPILLRRYILFHYNPTLSAILTR